MTLKLSVLIPVYNERRTIREIVARVLDQEIEGVATREIVIVDDHSTDGSRELIQELAEAYPDVIRAILLDENMGKGNAIRTAIEAASGDLAIVQDADLEYDPADYPTVLQPIIDGEADVVYGSRFTAREERRVLYYRHTIANRFLTNVSNWFTDLNLTDMETCYKAFRLQVAKTIPIRSRGFGIEPELTAKFAKRKLRIYEVPISYHGRTYQEGKKITWRDGMTALWTILKFWLIDDMFQGDYGHKDLIDMEAAPKYTEWTLRRTKPYVGNLTLEIGSGIGNNVRILMQYTDVIATEVEPVYLEVLRNAYLNTPGVDVREWDATLPPPADLPQPDSILCSNVLEHIEDDRAFVANVDKALGPGGRMIFIVPRGKKLYSSLDSAIGHYRRYDRARLQGIFEDLGYEVEEAFTLNKIGVLGWWYRGKIAKQKAIGRFGLKMFNILVPIFRLLDPILPWKGLSLVMVARKRA
ncbi:MAG: glycosyltransferase [Chloroflexota bacterium]|nr:glycosyltransferase [Chloroflexota bacterium]